MSLLRCIFVHFILFTVAVLSSPFLKECEPGEEAKEVNGTIDCYSCPEHTFSKDGIKCEQCSTCHVGQMIVNKCLPYRDAYCRCPPGQFLNPDKLSCERCNNCQAGSYQISDCKHNRDRQCRTCQKGKTTNTTNAKFCDIIKRPKPGDVPEKPREKPKILTIVISVFGAVILVAGFVAAFMCVRRKRVRRRRRRERNVPEEQPVEFEQPLLDQNSVQEVPRLQLIDLNLPNLRPFQIADIAYSDVGKISRDLNHNGPNNWEELARRLRLSFESIKFIKENVERRSQPVESVLTYYSTLENPTYAELYNELLKIRQKNCAACLKKYVLTERTGTGSSATAV